jgi:hypothetical protein
VQRFAVGAVTIERHSWGGEDLSRMCCEMSAYVPALITQERDSHSGELGTVRVSIVISRWLLVLRQAFGGPSRRLDAEL